MLSARPWNFEVFIHLLMGILFCVCLSVLAQGAIFHVVGKDKLAEGSLAYLLLGSLGLHGAILFAITVVLGLHRIRWREMFGFANRPIGRAIFWGVIICLIFLPLGMLLQEASLRALTWFHLPTPPQEAVVQFDKATSPGSRAYLIFFAVILAPVVEEVLFRGILYAVRQFGRPRLALWGSALAFSAMHLSASVFLPLLLFGLMQAWLYAKTDNLLSTITAHSLFNTINILLLFYGDAMTAFFQRLFPHLK